ncbi:MAG: nucleotidyl transferase AbiEii/AbiGii toxin family protein [Vicinamibacterales bacterium]
MDFGREIEEIGTFLTTAGFPFAVVGGVALAGYGHPRMTLDLDLVTEAAAQDAIVAFMEGRGFTTLHRSSGYSNHLHPDRRRGRVDFMYVRDETARRLFAGLRTVPGPGGRSIRVPRPEHLIAMKVQAMRDAPERMWQELVDIGHLAKLDGVDRDEVRGYFEKCGLLERWRELAQSF